MYFITACDYISRNRSRPEKFSTTSLLLHDIFVVLVLIGNVSMRHFLRVSKTMCILGLFVLMLYVLVNSFSVISGNVPVVQPVLSRGLKDKDTTQCLQQVSNSQPSSCAFLEKNRAYPASTHCRATNSPPAICYLMPYRWRVVGGPLLYTSWVDLMLGPNHLLVCKDNTLSNKGQNSSSFFSEFHKKYFRQSNHDLLSAL